LTLRQNLKKIENLGFKKSNKRLSRVKYFLVVRKQRLKITFYKKRSINIYSYSTSVQQTIKPDSKQEMAHENDEATLYTAPNE
jgi:hypothetical protein